MRQSLRFLMLVTSFALVVGSGRANALPVLQLDIVGGHYDSATQTIVSAGPSFTLVALLTPGSKLNPLAALLDTYYISASVTPQLGPANTNIGSFSWNGTEYNATSDMTYGTPPLEGLHATDDPGDLAPHSIYPTFFREFAFNFSPLLQTTPYNSADDPGGLSPTSSSTGTYYRTFQIETNLGGTYQLHFDLYDTKLKLCLQRRSCDTLIDEDIDHFAPFSHDAESGDNPPVPEPTTLALLGAGLAGGAARRWRQRRRS